MNQSVMASPVGRLLLGARDGKLVMVKVLGADEHLGVSCSEDPVLDMAQKQLAQYFAGEQATFDLPIAMRGTAFELAVWKQLREIPFGETVSYGQLAKILGKPSAARAVGRACSRNPLLIVVPCHRVVASSGRLTGFAGGMAAKRTLLVHEGHTIANDCITE